MLYFVVGTEPNEQEFSWHVGEGIPRIAKVDQIHADGHELKHLQSLGFAVDNDGGTVKLYNHRAMAALRAMRLHAASERPKTLLNRIGVEQDSVGKLRQQSALCNAGHRVVLVSSDPLVQTFLNQLEVIDTFPDTTNERGSFDEPTFKIRVAKR